MKVKVTHRRVFVGKEQIPVGTIVDVKGDEIPGYLVNKCVVVEEAKAEPAKKPEPAK